MKKIGMRNIKTAMAVFISLIIYVILLFIDKAVGIDSDNWHAPSNMYTPFFAGIAAVYATQRDRDSSFNQAKIRSFGSIIGGYFGMLLIMLVEYVFLDVIGLDLTNIDDKIIFKSIEFLIVALGIIPLIVITIKLKYPSATFITCLTYLSVTVSIRNGGMPVFQFATNRVLSTLVGVAIAVALNTINLKKKNKDLIFIMSIDNNILDSNQMISPYIKYKLNNLYYKKMEFYFVTTRTLASLDYIFEGVNVNKPMVVMNGSAIYDFENKSYLNVIDINGSERTFLDNSLEQKFNNYFAYTITNDIMHCYHNVLINEGEKDYFDRRNHKGYNYFVRGVVPKDVPISLYIVIDTKEKIMNYLDYVKEAGFYERLDLVYYPYDIDGYYYLKINSIDATKYNSIKKLNQSNKKIIMCGNGNTDYALMKEAYFSICFDNASLSIKSEADYIIDKYDPSTPLRIFDKLYHAKNIDKEIEKIKKKNK